PRSRGDRADHPGAGRPRSALRRLHRRRGLHFAVALSGEDLPARLAARARAPAGRHRPVRAQRHPGYRRGAAPPGAPRVVVSTPPLLETRALYRNFGALAAARDINFRLEAGARHALIGPNGAGKTTFVNLLTGVITPTSGTILMKGRDITAVAQAERVKLGIARTFQINRLFRRLSVLENVYIAVAERVGAAPSSPPGARVRSAPTRAFAPSISVSARMAETLSLRHVSAGYGETVVLEDIDLVLAHGESLSVIGRNGVGKTTLLATVMGHTT